MRSQTQSFLHVDPAASSRRIALLGGQTLADLHALVGESPGSDNSSVRFRVADRDQPSGTRIDDLDLSVGERFDYVVDADVREIIVEAIDH